MAHLKRQGIHNFEISDLFNIPEFSLSSLKKSYIHKVYGCRIKCHAQKAFKSHSEKRLV